MVCHMDDQILYCCYHISLIIRVDHGKQHWKLYFSFSTYVGLCYKQPLLIFNNIFYTDEHVTSLAVPTTVIIFIYNKTNAMQIQYKMNHRLDKKICHKAQYAHANAYYVCCWV
ncbi:hypothetical protein ACJX0J_019101 [Zea mays]